LAVCLIGLQQPTMEYANMNLPTPDEASPHKLGELIAGIEQSHHAFTRDALERITRLFDAMADAGKPAPFALRHCFDELQADLIPHLMKEERILFPYIIALENEPANPPHSCFGTIANPIRMMEIEHDHVKNLLAKQRELSSNYTATSDVQTDALYTALLALDNDLQQHIQMEDEVLFPQALQLETT
jgi:regulator of cell morphogenesis and NO signaling